MPLTGTFERTLDDKFRLAVPKPIRDELGLQEKNELFLAPGNEGCLSIYSTEGFERFARRLTNVSPGQANVRNYLRLFYARAERVVVDKQSRLRIPERLVTHAGLQQNVVVLGVNDHVEIWDITQWEQFLNGNAQTYDDLTTDALNSMLSEPPMDG